MSISSTPEINQLNFITNWFLPHWSLFARLCRLQLLIALTEKIFLVTWKVAGVFATTTLLTAKNLAFLLDLDWYFSLVSNGFTLITFQQNIFRFQISVCKSYWMQELNRLQWLSCDFSDVLNIKTFVFVFFDEIVKTLAQGLERKAHVCYSLLGPRIELFEHEPLF